jgi:hypothetical protein
VTSNDRKIHLRIESNGVEIFNAEVSEMQFSPGSEGVTLAAQYDPPMSKLDQIKQLAELKSKFGEDIMPSAVQLTQNDSVASRPKRRRDLAPVPEPGDG